MQIYLVVNFEYFLAFPYDDDIIIYFQDLQRGLDLGLVSPEVLQNFFDLEQYPFISELTQRFQVKVG